jgi:hypothetical protein
MLRLLPAAAFVLVLGAISADATTIAQFTFNESMLADIASSDSDPNSTASFLLGGPLGLDVTSGTPAPSLIVSLPFATGGVLSSSFGIELTPEAGFELNLASLQFDARRLFTDPGAPSATFFAALRSNLDGFAADVDTVSFTASPSTDDWQTFMLDLSASAFQGLSAADLAGVGGSLQLRFYFGMTSDPEIAGVNSQVDNVLVSGTTVPEPAAALLFVAAFAVLRRRVGALGV